MFESSEFLVKGLTGFLWLVQPFVGDGEIIPEPVILVVNVQGLFRNGVGFGVAFLGVVDDAEIACGGIIRGYG